MSLMRFLVPVAALILAACSRDPIGKVCTVITDCALGDQCVDGHCNAAEGEGEGAGEGEGEGEGSHGCVADSQCGQGFVCVGNVCQSNNSGACHTDAECTNGESCVSPDSPQCGGAPPPPPPPNNCADNSACGTGQVCDFVAGFCGSGEDQCITACSSDADCVAGKETCNTADGGRCEAISCTNGFTCPSWTACSGVAPDPLNDDSKHGCVPIPCSQDLDCPPPVGTFVAIAPSGFCVDSVCASGPGQCQAPVP